MPVEPVHRGILAADIEGFGRLERSNPVRVRLRAALYRLIDQSLAQAGIEPWRCEHSDHGDCVLVLLEPQISKTRLLHPFIPRLAAALERRNQTAVLEERLRLRVVIHAGEIVRDVHGHSGEDLNAAFRLLDSQPAHDSLAEADGDLAVIVSDAIYQSIVKHGYGRIDPTGYRAVTVMVKETSTTAWVHAPRAGPRPRGPRPRAGRPAPGTAPPETAASSTAPQSTAPAAAGVPGPPLPAELPADVGSFTGRRSELRRLRELLAGAGRRQAAVVAAIHGIAGVGKSAIAIHAAHQIAERFPDGQLYVDLGGASPGLDPLAPQEAIGRFLRALGVDGGSIPVALEEAVTRFRSELAGRRVLVVLDNAASAEQVRPLLPTAPGAAALITSREVLFALEGAVQVHLDVLSPADAIGLLRRLAGGERVAADLAAARTIALQCGLLPLALRIAGARLAARPSWPLHALAEQLADERRRLDRLQLGDLAVRASFRLSYDALLEAEGGELAARAFRLLGLLDGLDAGIAVAAALVDRPPAEVEATLERLVDAQMLESPVPGRYKLHDLLRLFAREQAHERERLTARRAALRRALRSYVATAERARRLVEPAGLRPATGGLSGGVALRDRHDALSWLETERGNLVAAARQAADGPTPLAAMAVRLAVALSWFLQVRGHWGDLEALNRLAVGAAQRAGDRRGESQAMSDLAGACHRMGRFDEAIGWLERSLRIRRDLGDRAGEGDILSNLGIVYQEAGRLDEAIANCEQSLAIWRERGHRYHEAIVLNNLGKIYRGQGDFDAAITAATNSLEIFRNLADPYGQGNALANLGEICSAAGRAEEAVDCCRRSLELLREVGDVSDEAEALWRLGNAWDALDQKDRAHGCWGEALRIFSAIGAPKAKEIERLLGDEPVEPLN